MTNEIIKTENLNGNEIDRLLICAIRCALHSSVQSFCLFPSMNVDSYDSRSKVSVGRVGGKRERKIGSTEI